MKYIYFLFGSFSLVLGIVGIFLPILPTTPFLLLSAALFFRSSPRVYHWLINQRYLGSYIRSFREDKSIPLHAKIVSVSLMWLTLLYIYWTFTSHLLHLFMLVVAVSVTVYILSFKTRKANE